MDWKETDNIYILWLMTIQCNYRCSYCFQKKERKRKNYQSISSLAAVNGIRSLFKAKGKNSNHAFKNYIPADWLNAFRNFHGNKLSMKISGGEPFLDRRNFTELLLGLTKMEQIKCLRIDTNGSWKANNFNMIDWDKITLNVSFHPEAISKENFIKSLIEKVESGIKIGMVNYVMAPDQYRDYEAFSHEIARIGIYTNPNVYFGPNENIPEIVETYPKYLPERDVAYKRKRISPLGRSCYFPSRSYEMDPRGLINRGCFPKETGNFLDSDLPKLPSAASLCPFPSCGCLDKYAFHEDFKYRGLSYDLLEEYVHACKKVWDPTQRPTGKVRN